MNANAPNTASCTTCCVCCKEIPLDAAFTPEGAELYGVGVSQIHPARHWCLLFYPTSCWKRKVRHRGQLQYQPG
ncbi:DUF3330 domain-containing protein [Vreelandella stevensii]|uniref:DUF3330 domain-containing protein n=1 Tax=Halomonadaceae TaxID=28256 RepID=UPI000A000696